MARTTAGKPAEETAQSAPPAQRGSSPAARKAAPRKAPARRVAATTVVAATGATTGALAVKSGEDPWTPAELEEVRSELTADVARLRGELDLATRELDGLMRNAGDGAGNDQADVGSTTFERDHELSLANHARDMLMQTEHALERIEDGSYGVCEACSSPIGKNRLMAFPRATLCLTCKQREERR